jgi:hypothetical protein
LWQEFAVGWINENHSKLHWNYVYDVMLKIILHYVELIEIIMLIVFENFVTKKYTCEERPVRKEWTTSIKQNENAKRQKGKANGNEKVRLHWRRLTYNSTIETWVEGRF